MRHLLEKSAKEKDESKAEQTKDMELQELLAENAKSSANKDSWKSGKSARGGRRQQNWNIAEYFLLKAHRHFVTRRLEVITSIAPFIIIIRAL